MAQGPRYRKMLTGLLATLTLLAAGPAGGEVYKWVDDDGQGHFSDRPNENSASEEVDTRQLNSYTSPEV